MGKSAAYLCLLTALATALAACAPDKVPQAESNQFPAKYRQEVVDTLKKLFVSNETIKVTGAFISDPALQPVDKGQHYTACVRYTAHGTGSGEIGTAVRIAYFYGGHLNQLIEASPEQCGNAAYKPFPELEKYCVGAGCQ
jgi:hypothetical protein